MYVKVKADGKFYYYAGSGSIRSTTDETECLYYNLKDKDDIFVIREILAYLFYPYHQEVTLVPVSETGERL